MVLACVLSWYDELDLDVLKTMRLESRWTDDPEYIRRRQERAFEIAEYATVHDFHANPVASDEEEEAEDAEADADEDDAGGDNAGDGDAGTDPKTGTAAP